MARTTALDEAVDSTVSAASRFEASDCLLQALTDAARRSATVKVEVPGGGRVWLNGGKEQFWSDIEDQQTFFTTPSRNARIRTESRPGELSRARPLEELLWTAGYIGSGGALLSRCQLYDVIELDHWPNFTRLAHSENLFPLCSLLAYRPTSLSFAYRMLRISTEEAFRFYSAATVSGHVRVVSSQPPRSATDPADTASGNQDRDPGVSAFWSRLFKRISGL